MFSSSEGSSVGKEYHQRGMSLSSGISDTRKEEDQNEWMVIDDPKEKMHDKWVVVGKSSEELGLDKEIRETKKQLRAEEKPKKDVAHGTESPKKLNEKLKGLDRWIEQKTADAWVLVAKKEQQKSSEELGLDKEIKEIKDPIKFSEELTQKLKTLFSS